MTNFPIDESYLIAAAVEGAFWGIYLSTFVCCMYATATRKGDFISVPIIAACVMFVLATAHWSLALRRLVHGFIQITDPTLRKIYFGFVGDHVNVAKDFLYITNMVIGDLILVWRLFIIWGRNKQIVILPILLVATTALGYGGVINWLTPNPLNRAELMLQFGTIMFSTSLVTNILVTILIAGRIWYTSSHLDGAVFGSSNRFRPAIMIIIESGFIISAAKLTEFTLFKVSQVSTSSGNHGLYIVYESMPQIQGIVPLLILIAVSLGLTRADNTYVNSGGLPTIQFEPGKQTSSRLQNESRHTGSSNTHRDPTSDLFMLDERKGSPDAYADRSEDWLPMQSLSSVKE